MTILIALGVIIFALGMVALEGWVVMLLWNWLMPMLFGLPTVTYWVALALMFLFSILTGGLVRVKERK